MDVNLLPDEALAQAVKGGLPGVPSWLALSTLSSRNAERATAPVAPPASTVADKVVQNLRSNGIAGAQQPNLSTPQAAPQQSPAPQGMASGGPVRFDDGGSSNKSGLNYNTMGQQLGIVPAFDPSLYKFNPSTYAPSATPGPTTLAGAQAATSPLFGKGPDYNKTIGDLQATDTPHPNAGLGNFIFNLLGGIGSGKGGFQQNFLSGLGQANAAEEEGNQKLFENKLSKQNSIRAAQEAQGTQAHEAATAALSLLQHNQTLAEAQDKAKYEAARGNEQGRLQAQQMAESAQTRRSQEAMKLQDLLSDPAKAATLANYADQNNLPDIAAVARGAQKSANAQQQIESDRQQRARIAEINAQTAAQMKELGIKAMQQGKDLMGHILPQYLDPLVDSIGQYKVPLTDRLESKDPVIYSQITEALRQKYPEWNEKKDVAISKLENSATAGPLANAVNANRAGVEHLNSLYNQMLSLGNSGFHSLNDISQRGKQLFGQNPQLEGTLADASIVATEVAKAAQGGGQAHVGATEDILKRFQTADTPAEFKQASKAILELLGEKGKQYANQVKDLGLPADHPIYKQFEYEPDQNEVFKRFGYDPDELTGHNDRWRQYVPADVKKEILSPQIPANHAIKNSDGFWYAKSPDGNVKRLVGKDLVDNNIPANATRPQ